MKGKGVFILVLLLSIAGLVFSLMTLDLHVEQVINPASVNSYCNISESLNCDAVLKSDWSVLFGRPVALYGVFFYLALSLFTLLNMANTSVAIKTKLDVFFVIASIALLDSLFLLYISVFHIKSVCPICAGVYVVNGLLWISLWFSDRSAGMIARILTGLGNLVLAPIRFFTIWFRPRFAHTRGFAVLTVLLLAGSVFATEESFFSLIQYRRTAAVDSRLEFPWPKNYTLPDTIRIDQGAWGDYSLGDPDAPIKIVEMFDYECGHCRQFYQQLKSLLKEYEGKYLLVYKNYPLDQSCNTALPFQGHKNACYSVLLARCAGEQGKFHEVSDFILTAEFFGRDVPVQKVRTELDSAITLFGLDETELRACMKDDRQRKQIEADIKLGDALGIEGTPTVWVNGKKLPGLDPFILKRVFDDILNK